MSSAAPPPPPPPPPPVGSYAPPPPPPPPPGGYVAAAGGGAGAAVGSVLSKLDRTGIRPTIAVAAVVLGLYLGSQVLNAIIPTPGTVGGQPGPAAPGPVQPVPVPTDNPGPVQPGPVQPGGQTVTIGPLRLTLPAGWDAGQIQNGFRMQKGGVAVDLFVYDGQGDANGLYAAYMNQSLAPAATGFGATEPTAVVIAGQTAARGIYNGAFGSVGQVEGQVTALPYGGKGYVFDAWGQMGTLRPLLPEVERMIDTIQVTG